jgi:DNA-binding transcriptional regulator YdaS (Cro superfamily)
MYSSDELLRAIKIIGSRQKMIKHLGISAQRLNAWLNGHIDMGYEYALALQYLTNGQIKAYQLTNKAKLIQNLGVKIDITDINLSNIVKSSSAL